MYGYCRNYRCELLSVAIGEDCFFVRGIAISDEETLRQALAKAKEYVAEGRSIVVDMDLEKFFDRVNHDILMERVSRKVRDKRVL